MKIKIREKIAFATGDLGCIFIWTFVSSFLMIYLTDTAGISAAAAGIILMVARCLDGVSDLFMGSLVDRTHSKMGKARPWILWGSIPATVCLILLFHVPGSLSNSEKFVYVLVLYIAVSLLYTVVNVPYQSLTALITNDSKEQMSISSLRFIFDMAGTLVISMATVGLVASFGGGQSGWGSTSLIFGVLFFICVLICVIGVREKDFSSATEKEKGQKQRPSFRALYNAILTNKYFYIIFIIYFLTSMYAGISAARIYYVQYVFGDANLYGIMAMIMMLPMILGIIITPLLTGKFGKQRICVIGALLAVAGYILIALFSENFVLFCIGGSIASFGLAPTTVSLPVFIANTGDLIDSKRKVRTEGSLFSCTTAGTKIGTGVGGAVVGAVLAAGKYIPNAPEQPASSILAMKVLNVYMPLGIGIAMVIMLLALNIERFMPNVQEVLNKRQEDIE